MRRSLVESKDLLAELWYILCRERFGQPEFRNEFIDDETKEAAVQHASQAQRFKTQLEAEQKLQSLTTPGWTVGSMRIVTNDDGTTDWLLTMEHKILDDSDAEIARGI